jgi:polyphenol oxidase
MIQLLFFNHLGKERKIRHFISTRSGGVSEGYYESLNLGLKAGDREESVYANRLLLAGELGLPVELMFFPDQCHTDNVRVIGNTDGPEDLSQTDALVTCRPGVAMIVLTADCVPVLLYDPVKQVIAAVHAGWKGTALQIVSKAIHEMVSIYSSDPADILAGIGPSISRSAYEVGDDLSRLFRLVFTDDTPVIRENPLTGKDHIDLQDANRILLRRAGLKDEHIEVSGLCTFSNPELFFSARRDGFHTGRFASGIFLIN